MTWHLRPHLAEAVPADRSEWDSGISDGPLAAATGSATIICRSSRKSKIAHTVPLAGLSSRARSLLRHHPDFTQPAMLRSRLTNAQRVQSQDGGTEAKALRAIYGDAFMDRKPLLQQSIPAMAAREEPAAYLERVAEYLWGEGEPQWEE